MGLDWGAAHKVSRAICAALAALTIVIFQSADAQTPSQSPTPEQLEVFRNLPPDQQRAILEAAGGQSGAPQRRDQQLMTPQTTAPPTQVQSRQLPPTEPPGPPRIAAGGTLLLDVTLIERQPAVEGQPPVEQQPPIDQATRLLLNARRDRIRAGNPYRLDEQGRLSLPTFPPLNLSGLTEPQASQRLNADPRLAGLKFIVTLLPIEPIGIDALKPFGYDVFGEVPTTFAPATDIPVPADYRVGPGDNVTVELFGKKSARYLLVVNRDGTGLQNLTLHPASDGTPTWSPNGALIAFTSDRSGVNQLYTMSATGTGVQRLVSDKVDRPTWSPLNFIAFTVGAGPGYEIGIYDFSNPGPVRILTDGRGSNESPAVAPNGRHIAFVTTRWGRAHIATIDRTGQNIRQITEVGNNTFPHWQPMTGK